MKKFASQACLSLVALAFPLACTDRQVIDDCIEQAKVSCAFQYQCCTDVEDRNKFLGGSLALLGVVFGTGVSQSEGECVEHATNYCENSGSFTQLLIGRGQTEYDHDAAVSCLDESKSALEKCDVAALREAGSCTTLKGLGESGDACLTEDECVKGSSCEIEVDDNGAPKVVDETSALPEGKCQDLAGEGEDCTEIDCEDGLSCNLDDVCEADVEEDTPEDTDFCKG